MADDQFVFRPLPQCSVEYSTAVQYSTYLYRALVPDRTIGLYICRPCLSALLGDPATCHLPSTRLNISSSYSDQSNILDSRITAYITVQYCSSSGSEWSPHDWVPITNKLVSSVGSGIKEQCRVSDLEVLDINKGHERWRVLCAA